MADSDRRMEDEERKSLEIHHPESMPMFSSCLVIGLTTTKSHNDLGCPQTTCLPQLQSPACFQNIIHSWLPTVANPKVFTPLVFLTAPLLHPDLSFTFLRALSICHLFAGGALTESNNEKLPGCVLVEERSGKTTPNDVVIQLVFIEHLRYAMHSAPFCNS